MQKRSRKSSKAQAKVRDFVVVTMVEDLEEAREYETLLKVNDIPAVVREQLDPSTHSKGIAVMVPEDHLDEAHVVIESQDAYDDFYDFSTDEQDTDEDFGSDDFDEEY
jgi:hypothetical protein